MVLSFSLSDTACFPKPVNRFFPGKYYSFNDQS